MPCATCDSQTCFTGLGDLPPGCPEQNRANHAIAEPADGYLEYVSKIRDEQTDRISELIAYANFKDSRHMSAFINDQAGQVAGVARVEAVIVLGVKKMSFSLLSLGLQPVEDTTKTCPDSIAAGQPGPLSRDPPG